MMTSTQEKLKQAKKRIEDAIQKSEGVNTLDDTYNVEYWTDKNDSGVKFHGLDLVLNGDSFLELYYEPIEKEYKDEVEKVLRYISGRLYFLSKDLSEIQDQMIDRHKDTD